MPLYWLNEGPLVAVLAHEVFSPGIWWIGWTMNRFGSEVHILATVSTSASWT